MGEEDESAGAAAKSLDADEEDVYDLLRAEVQLQCAMMAGHIARRERIEVQITSLEGVISINQLIMHDTTVPFREALQSKVEPANRKRASKHIGKVFLPQKWCALPLGLWQCLQRNSRHFALE